jgi:hypothetical protein
VLRRCITPPLALSYWLIAPDHITVDTCGK